jgi:hypothetical protein
MKRILRVEALPAYTLALVFDDGVEGNVDLSDLVGKGVFAVWVDEEAFRRVAIGSGGELVWSGGPDLCADALYLRMTGKRPADIFPSLRGETRVA